MINKKIEKLVKKKELLQNEIWDINNKINEIYSKDINKFVGKFFKRTQIIGFSDNKSYNFYKMLNTDICQSLWYQSNDIENFSIDSMRRFNHWEYNLNRKEYEEISKEEYEKELSSFIKLLDK